MISGAVILRSLRGFSAMKILPVFVAPPPPVNAITFWTAGSFLITSTIFWTESFMAGERESFGEWTTPSRGAGGRSGNKAVGKHKIASDGRWMGERRKVCGCG